MSEEVKVYVVFKLGGDCMETGLQASAVFSTNEKANDFVVEISKESDYFIVEELLIDKGELTTCRL